MVKVCPELRTELINGGKWPAFVAACERVERSGVKGASAIRDDAIDEVCPDLSRFKRRKSVKMFEVGGAGSEDPAAADGSCNAYRLLEWVVENFDDVSASAYHAPSKAAWAVLMASRKDEDTYRDVLKKFLDAKLKIDMAQGDTETRRMDGQREYDILEGMIAEEFA